MKIGDVVITPDGKARIKFFEDYSRIKNCRVCCELIDNPEKYSNKTVCYWKSEVNEIQNEESNA